MSNRFVYAASVFWELYMKTCLFFLCSFLMCLKLSASLNGELQHLKINSPSLENNLLGDSSERSIGVYLPASYSEGTQKYPVIYFLAGFGSSYKYQVKKHLSAFEGAMSLSGNKEWIVVFVDGKNSLKGSFYANSPVTGNWEDFISQDLVSYIDQNYRTFANKETRAIAGHSMGGSGALRIGMKYPDLFSMIYAFSPGVFDENGVKEFQLFSNPNLIYRVLKQNEKWAAIANNKKALKVFLESVIKNSTPEDKNACFTYAYAAAFSANPAKSSPFIDYPYSIENIAEVDMEILQNYEAGFGNYTQKIEEYEAALKSMKVLSIDVGKNDPYEWIYKGCLYVSEKLHEAGIEHNLTIIDSGHSAYVSEHIRTKMMKILSEALYF